MAENAGPLVTIRYIHNLHLYSHFFLSKLFKKILGNMNLMNTTYDDMVLMFLTLNGLEKYIIG